MTPAGGVMGGCFGMGCGVIFRLTPDATGHWNFRVLHTFTGSADGFGGSAGRLLIAHGHLYGVATSGGANGQGVVFELTPTRTGEWKFETIYAFKVQPDAGFPLAASFMTSSAIFMALHTLGARTAWVRFISWSDTAQAGMRLCFTVSKADRTETVRSALSYLIARAIFTARPAWMVTRDALVARSSG